jgi:hypothetical protein
MNMISTGAFQTGMDASNKQPTLAKKFAAIWEKKNAKAARAGGVSLMALSLAACGSDDATTTTATSSTDTTTTTTTTTTDPAATIGLTTATDIEILGSGDDTVMASGTTLGSDDVITDGGGADILKVSVAPATAANVILNTTGLETIQVINTGAALQTYTMTSATGVGTVKAYLGAATGDVTFSDLQANATVIMDGSSGDIIADFSNSVVVGAADVANVEIKNDATTDFLGLGDNADEFETINISVGSGKNSITDIEDSASADLTETSKLAISGSGQLTLGEVVLKDASEIDASAATGKMLITVDATVDKVTTGSANDTITLTVGDFGNAVVTKTIDGGAGDDTVVVAADLAASDLVAKVGSHSISAEILDADVATAAGSGADVTRTVDVAGITGLTKVTSTVTSLDNTGDDAIIAVTGIAAGSTIDATAVAGGHANAGNRVTMAIEDAAGTADKMTFDGDGIFEILDLDATADDATTTTKETGGIESLVVSSSDVNATTGVALTLTLNELEAYEVTNVDIVGSNKITIGALDVVSAATNANLTTAALRAVETVTIDASSATALFSLTTTETGYVTVLGGAGGIDVDLGATGTSKDIITGGSATTDKVTILDGTSTATSDPTITGVETIEFDTITSGDHTLSLKNVTGATTVEISDPAAAGLGFGALLTNVGTEEIYVKTGLSTGTGEVDFSGAVMSVNTATATTQGTNTTFVIGRSTNATTGVKEADPLDGTVFTTDTDQLTIRDEALLYDTAGSKTDEYLNHAVDIAGLSATETVTSLVLSGGGDTDGSTAAVEESTLTLVDNANVALTSIDATGWLGNLNVASLGDMATGTTIDFGVADSTLTVAEVSLGISKLVIDGGTGTDTVAAVNIAGGATHTYVINAANVEVMDLDLGDDGDAQLAATSIDLSGAAALTTIKLAIETAGLGTAEKFDENLTISGVANSTTIEFSSIDVDASGYSDDTNGSVTVNAGAGANTITINNKAATGAVTIGNGTGGLILGAPYKTATISNIVATDALTVANLQAAGLTSLSLDAATIASNGALTVSAVAAANLETLTIDSGIGAVTVSDLGTVSKLETFTVDTGDATASAKTLISAGISTSVDTITAAGSGAFEITALTASSLDSVDASGVTGIVTLGTAAAAITSATDATLKSGTGNDSITMSMTASRNLDAGEKTSDTDALVLVGVMNSGTGVINLNSATDQITSINGFADASTQVGFENVNVSAVTSTGSFGFQVTANASGSVITTSASNDTVILGAGADDVVLPGATAALNGTDTITAFTTLSDDINLNALTASTALTALTSGADTIVTDKVYLLASTGTNADTKTASASALDTAFDGTGTLTDDTDTHVAYMIVSDANSTSVYEHTATNGETGITATELTLIATVDAVLVAGDILFA